MKRRIAALPGTALRRLSANMAERKRSPYYVPAPWGDRERGELIEHGHSPTRAKRWARKAARALLGTALLTATALAPSAAVPGAGAHQSNYVGYGCSGWTEVRFFPPLAAQDCWSGQQSGGWLLMRHDYSGVWAPGTYLSWERLW